jgi:ATP-dependent RNA helicase DeaD
MPFPDLPGLLARALKERGYDEPTPVQEAVLQPEMAGRDLLVSAQTGSGKTVAYGLALGMTLFDGSDRLDRPGRPRALVIAPTRELALQVQRELAWLFESSGARVLACVGGMDQRREQRALAQGAHVVVGTPGRLRDHIERSHLDLSDLAAVVLDEADEMLDLGFRDDLEAILDTTPQNRRTLLFSATLPKDILSLARSYQRDAERIALAARDRPHGDIAFRAVSIAPHEADAAIVNILRFYDSATALVFCATREGVRRLHGHLLEKGFAVVALSGELGQAERNRALQSLRDGRARVCVATDVAARGIDLPDLGLVIHADLPNGEEAFLHRSGRTGRAGRKGVCVVPASFGRRRKAERLLAAARAEAHWTPPPSAAEILKKDLDRLIRETEPETDVSEEERADARTLLAGRSAEDLALALIRMHRAGLPAPEDLTVVAERGPRERAVRTAGTREPERDSREHGEQANVVRFALNVGRRHKADPKWLVPFLCRRGHVTRHDIGRIEIFDRHSVVGITSTVADRFAHATAKPDPNGENIVIRRDTEDGSAPPRRDRERDGARTDRMPSGKPHRKGARAGGDRSARRDGGKGPRS